ncbi:hypothetical protein EJ06DRAFT_23051 [Trichodelitschia bisporula]|uniref:TUG ubiquitin-like domain-containing protein n=1 Tax=Trichodelitschia bisporula TaxID=703511 RepID=A0A6G1IAZ9_9PEZI|nr:hypothetical protein EJ06DRAFT_23051 [Trichodelitschia bisporula]
MASHVVVIDSSLRRCTVKTTPGMYLSDVAAQACKKFGLAPENYSLKYNKKQVDLSRTYRLAGLPSGAQLELVQASRSPTVVNVALQLPPNEGNTRLTDKFPSSTSLWQILRRFEAGVAGGPGARTLNLTQRGIAQMDTTSAGRLFFEMPVVNVVGRECGSFTELQKTLAQLGITGGSALLRLGFRNSGQPLEEAMRDISTYFDGLEQDTSTTEAHGAHAAPPAQFTSVPEVDAEPASVAGETNLGGPDPEVPAETPQPSEPKVTTATTTETKPTPPHPANPSSPEPTTNPNPSALDSLTVYAAPESSTPAAASTPFSPADYEPTIDHAKSHQAALAQQTRNKRLPSDRELADAEAARQARLSAIAELKLKVRLPDQMQVARGLGREHTTADVYAWVRGLLASPEPFVLRYVDRKGANVVLPDGPARLVQDVGWTGAMLVTMLWGEGVGDDVRRRPCLKDEVLGLAQPIPVPEAQKEAPEEEKKGFFAGVFGKDQKKGNTLSGAEKEAKLKGLLRFGKK